MSIRLGATEIRKVLGRIRKGNRFIQKVYLNGSIIWEPEEPTPQFSTLSLHADNQNPSGCFRVLNEFFVSEYNVSEGEIFKYNILSNGTLEYVRRYALNDPVNGGSSGAIGLFNISHRDGKIATCERPGDDYGLFKIVVTETSDRIETISHHSPFGNPDNPNTPSTDIEGCFLGGLNNVGERDFFAIELDAGDSPIFHRAKITNEDTSLATVTSLSHIDTNEISNVPLTLTPENFRGMAGLQIGANNYEILLLNHSVINGLVVNSAIYHYIVFSGSMVLRAIYNLTSENSDPRGIYLDSNRVVSVPDQTGGLIYRYYIPGVPNISDPTLAAGGRLVKFNVSGIGGDFLALPTPPLVSLLLFQASSNTLLINGAEPPVNPDWNNSFLWVDGIKIGLNTDGVGIRSDEFPSSVIITRQGQVRRLQIEFQDGSFLW